MNFHTGIKQAIKDKKQFVRIGHYTVSYRAMQTIDGMLDVLHNQSPRMYGSLMSRTPCDIIRLIVETGRAAGKVEEVEYERPRQKAQSEGKVN